MSRYITSRTGTTAIPENIRRRRLVDVQLQGVLLAALVVLEVGMLGGATLYLYFQFNAVIDQNLFVIHRSGQRSLLPAFLKEMGTVVMVMSIVNTFALLAAHKLWVRHIQAVTRNFRDRLARIRSLDLRPHPDPARARHEVLDKLELWRRAECQRYADIDQLLASLPEPGEGGYSNDDLERILALMERCRERLSQGGLSASGDDSNNRES